MWTKDSSFELPLPSVIPSEAVAREARDYAVERPRAAHATQSRKGCRLGGKQGVALAATE